MLKPPVVGFDIYRKVGSSNELAVRASTVQEIAALVSPNGQENHWTIVGELFKRVCDQLAAFIDSGSVANRPSLVPFGTGTQAGTVEIRRIDGRGFEVIVELNAHKNHPILATIDVVASRAWLIVWLLHGENQLPALLAQQAEASQSRSLEDD